MCACGLLSPVPQTQAECQPSSALLGFVFRGPGHPHDRPPRPLFLVAPVPRGRPAATFQIRYSSSRRGRLPARPQRERPALPSRVGWPVPLQACESREPFLCAVPPCHPCSVQGDMVRRTNGFWPGREGFLTERIPCKGPAFSFSNISSSEWRLHPRRPGTPADTRFHQPGPSRRTASSQPVNKPFLRRSVDKLSHKRQDLLFCVGASVIPEQWPRFGVLGTEMFALPGVENDHIKRV